MKASVTGSGAPEAMRTQLPTGRRVGSAVPAGVRRCQHGRAGSIEPAQDAIDLWKHGGVSGRSRSGVEPEDLSVLALLRVPAERIGDRRVGNLGRQDVVDLRARILGIGSEGLITQIARIRMRACTD